MPGLETKSGAKLLTMQLTLLGTGNAAGMPLYGCQCAYCEKVQQDPTLRRESCSALLEVNGKRYLIDAGLVNLDQRFPPGSIDGIFITHFHPDHVQGLFHLRWGINQCIPVYCPPDSEGCADLYKHSGILDFQPQKKFQPFELNGIQVIPLPLIHSKVTFGYLFEQQQTRVAYLTDTKGLPSKTQDILAGNKLDLLVIDCTFVPGSEKQGHNNLDDVLEIVKAIKPNATVLTHIGHDLDIWLRENHQQLPEGIYIGSDNTVVLPLEGV